MSHGRPLLSETLAADFAAGTDVTRRGVGTLCQATVAARPPEFGRWTTLFGKACGLSVGEPRRSISKTIELLRLEATTTPDVLLFALHTYYAIIIDALVGRFAELEGVDLLADGPLGWFRRERHGTVRELVDEVTNLFEGYDVDSLPGCSAGGDPTDGDPAGGDLLKDLYQQLFPRPLRNELGEYYTPDWLADHLLDLLQYHGDTSTRLLDPSCGSGTFLIKAIRRIRARHENHGNPRDLCRAITAGVVGFDLNPSAVLAARANYLIAIRDLVLESGPIEIPVYLCDSILDDVPRAGRFDLVVGNPPWIAWDNLPDDYRQATKPLWQAYGLFSLSGTDARHGGGKKDLSSLMLAASADRWLGDGGRLAMVITQTIFQSKGAGDGFRRFRLGPEGRPLGVLRVDDMVAIKPFKDAANWTSTILLEKGTATKYPVDYVKWLPGQGGFSQQECLAEPIDPRAPSSPWLVCPKNESAADLRRMVGPSDYTAHLGANSGGANGVYWLEVLGSSDDGVMVRNLTAKGKRAVESVRTVIEPDLLYPLVRWGDVSRFAARPSAHILLAQDVDTRSGVDESLMRQQYPKTYAYLSRFADMLLSRSAYRKYQGRRPFYSMYNVGRYTISPLKVVWRRMDRRINAAVLEPYVDPVLGTRPVIPQETCVLIDCQSAAEAHYICAVLNSSPVNTLITAHSVDGGKGFGTPGMLDFVNLHRFDTANPLHIELSQCSIEAHRTEDHESIQDRIDSLAKRLWDG